MRPAGAVCQALLAACERLAASGRGATLQELASAACVGQQAARNTVPSLKRRGALLIVGQMRVPYRNRPVALYAPRAQVSSELADSVKGGAAAVMRVMAAWAGQT